jgi:O-antigen/teichoic acid export membrane protein
MVSGVAVTLVNIAVLAVAYPMYLHFLGYEQYGVWLVLSTVLTFAQLGNLGIGQAVMKLVAEEYSRHDLEAAQQYMTSALVILAASGAVVLALIVLFQGPIVALFKLSEENAQTVSWMLPYIACLSIYVFIVQAVNAMLSGFGRMDLANYAQTGGRLVAVLVASLLLFLGTGIEGLLIGSAASDIFTHILSLTLIRRVAPVRMLRTGNLSLSRVKRLLGFGSGVLGGSLLSMLLSPFNKLMLSRYAGVASIPIYEIAYTGSMQIRGLAEAGIRALMPEVSRLGANMTEQARDRIREINRRSVGLILWFALPLYGVLILAAPLLLRIWLGDRFVEVLPLALRIALVGSLLSLACVPAYYLLLGLGRVRDCFLGQAILAGVNVLLVLAFAWMDGDLSLPEVLIATLIGMGVSSAYIIVQSHRTLKYSLARVAVEQDLLKEIQVCPPRASVHA